MHLFGSTDSGHTFKVRSFLLLAKIAHDYEWIDLAKPRQQRPAAFMAASKFGEVPVLLDQGRAMCQSNAILIYLARQYQVFCGNDENEWQMILEWLSWETNRIGFSVPNLRYSMRWDIQPEEVLAYLRKRALTDLGSLEQILAKQAYLLPSGLSIADLSCSAYLFWLDQIQVEIKKYPHIQAWLKAISTLPGWLHPDLALKSIS